MIGRRRSEERFVALVAELQTAGPGNTLRNALRRALGDPHLEIAYARLGSAGWMDEDGRSITAPVAAAGRAVTPVHRGGKPFAALIHDPALLRNTDRLHAAVSAAALAFDNEQLKADLRAEIADLRASRARIVEAGDLERRRVERNLHDGAQQRLVGLSLMLHSASRMAGTDPERAAVTLSEAARELDDALAELRELARGIHPGVVSAAGLIGALEALAERPGVPIELELDVPVDLPELVEVAAYYVVAEALANAKKHADASVVTVRASLRDDALVVAVSDDGRGGAVRVPGSGLEGLADRVGALDGSLDIESPAGQGTVVTAVLPLAGSAQPERDLASLAALCWIGWETFEIPAEAYNQITHENQRSWVRGMYACAGGVSRITPAERSWAVGYEAVAGAAPWVLDSLRTYEVDETVAEALALPGMENAARGLLYDGIRLCGSDGPLAEDELDRLQQASDDLGLSRDYFAALLAVVEEEQELKHRRYELITAPVLPT